MPKIAQLRAVAVAAHVFAVLVLATPSTGGLMNRRSWQQPSVQEEFATWGARLGGMSGPELEEVLWSVVTSYHSARSTLIVPLEPYRTWCGTDQGWQLFAAPERHPARLEVQIDESRRPRTMGRARSSRYRTVYLARSDGLDWNRDFFDQDRIRTVSYLYTWPHYRRRGLTRELADYLAPRIQEDFPDAWRFRIRFLRASTARPEQVVEGISPPVRVEGVLERVFEER